MKRGVHILLLASCLIPLIGVARDETLEERKRRITRKYMRERTTTVQSGILVPVEEEPKQDQVLDSERFALADVGIAREEGGIKPPPPMQQRPVQQVADRNWLLSAEDDVNNPFTDPYADPYADPYGTPKKTEAESNPLSQWEYQDGKNSQQNSGSSWIQFQEGDSRRSSLLGRRTDGSSSSILSPSSRDNNINARTPALFDFQKTEEENTASALENPFSRLSPGVQSEGKTYDSRDRSFGSEGRRFGSDGLKQQGQSSGFTTRRVPFQNSSRMNGIQQPGSTQQPEFQRTNPYQEWKQKNKTIDPMRDDAFLDGNMPNFGN